MERIETLFHEQFGFWNITLPEGAVAAGKAGAIWQYDWVIQYQFGHDEYGKYMDYYAKRLRKDGKYVRSHRRLHEVAPETDRWDEGVSLPTPHDTFLYYEWDSKGTRDRRRREWIAENERAYKVLKNKFPIKPVYQEANNPHTMPDVFLAKFLEWGLEFRAQRLWDLKHPLFRSYVHLEDDRDQGTHDITYAFGTDEEGDYLHYADSTYWNETVQHVRLYASGKEVCLPVPSDGQGQPGVQRNVLRQLMKQLPGLPDGYNGDLSYCQEDYGREKGLEMFFAYFWQCQDVRDEIAREKELEWEEWMREREAAANG